MKKIALLLSLAFLTFSCSDDDSVVVDEPVDGSEPAVVDEPLDVDLEEDVVTSLSLVGVWEIVSQKIDGEEDILDQCGAMDILTVKEDTYFETNYREGDIRGECIDRASQNDFIQYTATETMIMVNGSTLSYLIDGSQLTIIDPRFEDVNEDGIEDEGEVFDIISIYTRQ